MFFAEINNQYQIKVLVCAVERGSDVLFQTENMLIQEGDRLHGQTSHKEIGLFLKCLEVEEPKLKKF